MMRRTRPSEIQAPLREVKRSESGLRTREAAMPSTSPGIALASIANKTESNLNLSDDGSNMPTARRHSCGDSVLPRTFGVFLRTLSAGSTEHFRSARSTRHRFRSVVFVHTASRVLDIVGCVSAGRPTVILPHLALLSGWFFLPSEGDCRIDDSVIRRPPQ